MRPEAMAMAIDRGLYAFHAVIFEEVLPVVLVRNAAGKVSGIGTPRDVGPLRLLLTLARSGNEKSSSEKSVTVTKTRNIGAKAKKTVAVKSSHRSESLGRGGKLLKQVGVMWDPVAGERSLLPVKQRGCDLPGGSMNVKVAQSCPVHVASGTWQEQAT